MNRLARRGVWTLLLIGWCVAPIGSLGLAADVHAASPTTTHEDGSAAKSNGVPVLSEPSRLPVLTLIGVVTLFLMAAIIGPVAVYHAPEPPPEPSTHDDHGHGHNHGHGGHGH